MNELPICRTGFAQRTTLSAGAAIAEQIAHPAQKKRPGDDELHQLMQQAQGNVAAIARALQRDRALVHRWLKDAGLDPDAYRLG